MKLSSVGTDEAVTIDGGEIDFYNANGEQKGFLKRYEDINNRDGVGLYGEDIVYLRSTDLIQLLATTNTLIATLSGGMLLSASGVIQLNGSSVSMTKSLASTTDVEDLISGCNNFQLQFVRFEPTLMNSVFSTGSYYNGWGLMVRHSSTVADFTFFGSTIYYCRYTVGTGFSDKYKTEMTAIT